MTRKTSSNKLKNPADRWSVTMRVTTFMTSCQLWYKLYLNSKEACIFHVLKANVQKSCGGYIIHGISFH